MKLPPQKKILREDLKEAPKWVNGIIEPINSFMESVYQAMNHNMTLQENVASQVKEITYTTSATYPLNQINAEFQSTLRTKPIGLMLMQAYDKSTYVPASGPVYIPWIEDGGTVIIYPIKGLEASKTYLIRLVLY